MHIRLLSVCGLFIVLMQGAWTDDSKIFEQLETRWESAREEIGIPGMAIAVVKDGSIVYEKGFGYRDLEARAPFTADTATYIASATKTFITLAVMQLVDQGKVELDSPVKAYLPRFQLADPALTDSITIRDLLCHRYGLSNWPITFAEAYTGILDDDFYYRELVSTEVKGSWSYSNLHFTLLGRVIESVTGQPWQDYLRNHVFQPANMDHTTARADELYAFADCATPYTFEDGKWQASSLRKCNSVMHAAGGIGSSAHDLARWLLLHLNHGVIDDTRIVSDAAVQQILTVETEPGSSYFRFGRRNMGLGWYLGDYKGDLLVHHFGSYAGAHAHISFMPEYNLGVAVVANSNEDSVELVHRMAADVYDVFLDQKPGRDLGRFVRKMKRETKKSIKEAQESSARTAVLSLPQPLDAYTGIYVNDTWGVLEVSREGDTLQGRDGNFPLAFYQDEDETIVAETPITSAEVEFLNETDSGIGGINVLMADDWAMRFERCEPGQEAQLAFAVRGFDMPSLEGDYAVGRMTWDVVCTDRKEIFSTDPEAHREIRVDVYYPAKESSSVAPGVYLDPRIAEGVTGMPASWIEKIRPNWLPNAAPDASGAPYPVLLFSPGVDGPPALYTSLLEQIASRGYIIVALWHPYTTSRTIFPDGRIIEMTHEGNGAMWEGEDASRNVAKQRVSKVWAEDTRTALDEVVKRNGDGDLRGQFDLNRVGVFGHSFGGQNAAAAMTLDPRIRAGLNMDGTAVYQAILDKGVTGAFTMVYDNSEPPYEYLKKEGKDVNDWWTEDWTPRNCPPALRKHASTFYIFQIDGLEHEGFSTDLPLLQDIFPSAITEDMVGTVKGKRILNIMTDLICGYFNEQLSGEDAPILHDPEAVYPELHHGINGHPLAELAH